MKKLSISLLMSLFMVFSLTSSSFGFYQKKGEKEVVNITASEFNNKVPELVGKIIIITGTVENLGKNAAKVLFLANGSDNKIKVVASKKVTPFTEDLKGKTLDIKGIVKETIIDDEYINNIKNQKRAETLRKKLKESGKDHLSAYFIVARSYKIVE
jgi:hypothetical protein